MATIFGALSLNDNERVFQATIGQTVIYDEIQKYLTRVNTEMQKAMGIFVAETTSDHKRRYKLPGGGTLQRSAGAGRYGAVRANGGWDVGYPLEDFGDQLSGDNVSMAYMTVKDLDNHVQGIAIRNINTVRREILNRLFTKIELSFVDPLWGTLLVEPLANGDTVVYPPVLGASSESTVNHYLGSNYAATAISDTNNPFATIRDELEEHFGQQMGGSPVIVFIHKDQRAKVEALVNFDEVVNRWVIPGANTDRPAQFPIDVPGTPIGVCNGCLVVEYNFIPSGYMFGIYFDAAVPAPLVRRIDPADTGLGDGLQLVLRDPDFPFDSSFWRHRFGFGAGNRLNGVAMQLVASTTYTSPTFNY